MCERKRWCSVVPGVPMLTQIPAVQRLSRSAGLAGNLPLAARRACTLPHARSHPTAHAHARGSSLSNGEQERQEVCFGITGVAYPQAFIDKGGRCCDGMYKQGLHQCNESQAQEVLQGR